MPVVTQEPSDSTSHEVIYDHGPRDAEQRSRVPAQERTTDAVMTGGSSLELLGGAAAVILAILALSGILPLTFTAIATICIGAALLAHGAAAAARYQDTIRHARSTTRAELGGGIGSEVLGGAAGVALGILALANVIPLTLLPVAAIVLGGSVLFGSAAQPELARMASDRDPRIDRMTYTAVEGTTGAMVLAGIAAVILGILALINVGPPVTMTMVAMLALGGALVLGGSALTARFGRRLQHA